MEEISVESEKGMRCKLRERFLKATSNLNGKQCSFNLYGSTSMTGKFCGADIEFNNILAEHLQNPTKSVKNAILRASDINVMQFDNVL